ncbi:hypothetical protein KY314_04020 [Candidatus Woesearchaeota archaeon]|nr:hypothetical protein [Candidatus Woesearchaeota archaeon]
MAKKNKKNEKTKTVEQEVKIRLENGKRLYVYTLEGEGAYKIVSGSLKGTVKSEIRTMCDYKGRTADQEALVAMSKAINIKMKNGYEVVAGDIDDFNKSVELVTVGVIERKKLQKKLESAKKAYGKVAKTFVEKKKAFKTARAELKKLDEELAI